MPASCNDLHECWRKHEMWNPYNETTKSIQKEIKFIYAAAWRKTHEWVLLKLLGWSKQMERKQFFFFLFFFNCSPQNLQRLCFHFERSLKQMHTLQPHFCPTLDNQKGFTWIPRRQREGKKTTVWCKNNNSVILCLNQDCFSYKL